MVKIGRNDPCPCGSGKKYKKCCIEKDTPQPAAADQITIAGETETLLTAAQNKEATFKNIGVFIFFSTAEGDAWLLELTDQDALQVAKGGEKIDVEIQESPETIEVNWSHKFSIKDRQFHTVAYIDKSEEFHPSYPSKAINAAIQRIHKSFSTELIDSIHIDQ